MKYSKGQIIRKDSEKVLWVMQTNHLYDTVCHVSFKNNVKIMYKFYHADKSQEVMSRTPITDDECFDYMGRFNLEVMDDPTQTKESE